MKGLTLEQVMYILDRTVPPEYKPFLPEADRSRFWYKDIISRVWKEY